jgi:AraC-like DNA-binding protein
MRPQLHKLFVSPDSSFLCKKWECNYFDKPWHFHKEYELVLIEKAEGTRFIGDNVSFFKDGDLILIGPNIPHLYRNSEKYYKNPKMVARSIFIHFTDDFLGNHFFDLPEMKQVRKILVKSALGIEIKGETREFIKNKLIRMVNEPPARRLISLLEILVNLSASKELDFILSQGFIANNNIDTDRINTVFQYILKNFTEEIYIEEIAAQMNMSIASFSRYFKHHTRKTFSNYVTEIRISHACRLLMEGNHSVSEISYLSGFENKSNFYRHFKNCIGLIPRDYQQRFMLSP